MKKNRFIHIFLIILLLVISGCDKKEVDINNPVTEKGVISNLDVAIVMDTSGSMLESDPNRIALEAAEMFVDMQRMENNRTAIIEFAQEVTNTGLIELNSLENKNQIKSTLDSTVYKNQAYTDTGLGLKEAVNLLAENQSGNKKQAVLLFTDGHTEIYGDRTVEQSLNDVQEAIQLAIENDITIYTVGLNSDGSVREEELNNISLNTGGKVQISSDMSELPTFFNNIFKELGNIDDIILSEFKASGDYDSVDFEVDNSEVLEANLVFLSAERIQDIQLTNPQGKLMPLDNEQIVVSYSNHYTVLKIINPENGAWNIKIKGVQGDSIRISLLYNYEIELTSQVSKTIAGKGDNITISAYLTSEGVMIMDDEFYDSITASAKIVSQYSGETVLEMPFENHQYKLEYELKDATNYTVQIHLEGRGLYRDSQVFDIQLDSDTLINKSLKNINLEVGEAKEIDLSSYFVDPNGEMLTYEFNLVRGAKSIEYDIDYGKKPTLTLNGIDKGQANLEILARNTAGNAVTVTLKIKVISAFEKWVNILGIPGLLIVFTLVGYFIYQRKRSFYGKMNFRLSMSWKSVDTDGNENSVALSPQARSIVLSTLKKEFNLADIINKKYQMNLQDDQIENLKDKVKMCSLVSKIKVSSTIKRKQIYLEIPESTTEWDIILNHSAQVTKKEKNLINYLRSPIIFRIDIQSTTASNCRITIEMKFE